MEFFINVARSNNQNNGMLCKFNNNQIPQNLYFPCQFRPHNHFKVSIKYNNYSQNSLAEYLA